MTLLSAPIKLLLSLLIGAAIGLERESYDQFQRTNSKTGIKDKKGSLGVRTFSLITTLGALAGLLRPDFPDLFITINVVFLILLVAYYVTGSIYLKDNGITTEMAIIFSYLIGIFIALDIFPIQMILALSVILILILSQKNTVKQWIAGISQSEVTAFISYSIIALVILPFLPNQNYSLADLPGFSVILENYSLASMEIFQIAIINPYSLWFIVALITGVEVFGYLMGKTLGQKKGWLLTSSVAGFVSSTSTTVSLAQKSRKSSSVNRLVAAAIFANLASFVQIFILIALTNGLLLVKSLLVIFSIILSSLIIGLYYLKKGNHNSENLSETKSSLQQMEIFSLKPALKFAMIFLVVSTLSKFALYAFGDSGFYFASALAALTGLDAVILNLSAIAGNTLTYHSGVWTIVIVNAVNLLSKSVYVYLAAKREFALSFLKAMVIIILSSLFAILI